MIVEAVTIMIAITVGLFDVGTMGIQALNSITNFASMSSDHYAFDTYLHTHSNSGMVSSDGGGDLSFFSDPYSLFTSSPTQKNNNSNPFDEILPSFDPFPPSFSSLSPPNAHLENLSLYLTNSVQPQSNGPISTSEFGSFSACDGWEVKNEECQMGVDYTYNQQFLPHSYSGTENIYKYMQRSFSSNSFEGKPDFLFQPHCDTLIDSPKFQRHDTSSPEHTVFAGQMRRVCSTGDLQNMQANHMSQTEGPMLEEPNFKVGRYSAEEKKEKISKYRAKRTQRNFNKTIKYACRKTLADNRPRIRGRFARNDEASEIPKAPCSPRDEGEFNFWVNFNSIEELRLHEEQDDVTVGAGHYVKSHGVSQFQYCGF
ncbi:two-component response regulator-like APRR5 [Gastrolobium bilobum]|uniref:two-component response regulator-like APRR5 n=1 Tax=Gastrolobium bilobum TaxID=150636 RepID=UPI002AB31862|nr:two-component response regulator-like APRR5 [Gastrolobium bilobum]